MLRYNGAEVIVVVVNCFRLSAAKQSKVYLPEFPFPHAEVIFIVTFSYLYICTYVSF